MPRTTFYLATLLLIVGLFSCGDEVVTNEPGTAAEPTVRPANINYPPIGSAITTSISGRVIDNDGQPIYDATITCVSCANSNVTATDASGSFALNKIVNEGDQAFLAVTYPGKFDGYRRMALLENRNNYTSIQLRDKTLQGAINTEEGGTVTTTSGATLTLPQEGILDENGNVYNGIYEVYLSWIDPTDPNLNETMMGDLSAIDTDGNLMGLSTFGMLQVELESPQGMALNLSGGATAELSFPVPSELRDLAPATIPLWSYDESAGYWIEEGAADLVGNNYVGTVTHFSTWNVDSKFDPIDLCGDINIISRGTEVGLAFFEINLSGESFNSVGGWLCEDGSFTFMNVPSGEVFTLEVINYCGEIVETLELGPYSEDTKLDPITILNNEGLGEVFVQGNALTCDGNPVTNGIISVVFDNRTLHFPVDNNGNFLFAVPTCGNLTGILSILNLDDFSSSIPIPISNVNDNFIFEDLALCEEYEEYFFIELSDDPQSTNPIFDEPITNFVTDAEDVWYSVVNGQYHFKMFNNDPQSPWTHTVGFTIRDIILNQPIQGLSGDGLYGIDSTGVLVSTFNGDSYKFLFTDLGPLNSDGLPSYIQGNFEGDFITDEACIKGFFKLKPE